MSRKTIREDKYPHPKFAPESVEIFPCPFCGSKAVQTSNGVATLWYWVSCRRGGEKGCNASGPIRRTALGAIKAWNRSLVLGRTF